MLSTGHGRIKWPYKRTALLTSGRYSGFALQAKSWSVADLARFKHTGYIKNENPAEFARNLAVFGSGLMPTHGRIGDLSLGWGVAGPLNVYECSR